MVCRKGFSGMSLGVSITAVSSHAKERNISQVGLRYERSFDIRVPGMYCGVLLHFPEFTVIK